MLLNTLIIALGLQISFIDFPQNSICGTYYHDKRIVITLAEWCDPDETLYHELGHALFINDKEVIDTISQYPPPRYYYDVDYPAEEKKLNERVADYFAMYLKYPDFKDKFPKLQNLFNNKLKIYENSN